MRAAPPRRRAAFAGVVSALLLALGLAGPAAGHAGLVLASPFPGSGLAQAPGSVILKFSEPLNVSLSRIEVIDSSGLDVGDGATLPVEGDDKAMRRTLGLLPVGQYTVRWTSVSTLDGHTLQGSYRFGVGTAASAASEVRDSPLDSEGPLGLLGRFAALIGLVLWAGAVVLRRASQRAGLAPATVARLARGAPALVAVGTSLSIASSSLVATGSLAALGGVFASPSGLLRLTVVVAAALGLLVGPRVPWAFGLVALVAVLAEAASGHAAASPLPPLAVGSFALHLAAAGVWVYAIVAGLLASTSLRQALATFTPYAVGAAAVTALTGITNAALALTGPADLLATGYGLAVLWKVGAFALMVSLGSLHFVLRRRADIAERRLSGPVRGEMSAALAAVALATLLVGFPNPPREAESAEQLTGLDPVLAQLGEREALSVAEASGPFVVGMTFLPPRPGAVEVRVQVIGVEPGDGLRDARLIATSAGTSLEVPLLACGLGCFGGTASLDVEGEWRLEVAIASNRGAIDVSATLPLPAADGTAEFARALAAMEGLRTATLEERLRGSTDGPLLIYRYRFQAPDRLRLEIGEAERIIIGERDYSRQGSGAWGESSFPAPGFSWPGDYYRSFWRGAVAARILGTETVDGVPSRVVAFVRPELPAWFRIWVGIEDGLVRRMEMRAQGHLMSQLYSAFDAPLMIEPPS